MAKHDVGEVIDSDHQVADKRQGLYPHNQRTHTDMYAAQLPYKCNAFSRANSKHMCPILQVLSQH